MAPPAGVAAPPSEPKRLKSTSGSTTYHCREERDNTEIDDASVANVGNEDNDKNARPRTYLRRNDWLSASSAGSSSDLMGLTPCGARSFFAAICFGGL